MFFFQQKYSIGCERRAKNLYYSYNSYSFKNQFWLRLKSQCLDINNKNVDDNGEKLFQVSYYVARFRNSRVRFFKITHVFV